MSRVAQPPSVMPRIRPTVNVRPAPVDWVPLLVMALTVGVFESVFFRGFIQGRLEAALGAGPAVFGAAAMYAVYHVGYGMGG